MADASLVTDLAIVLGVAAATGTITRALQQPPILGYLIAGLFVGPYIPIPLFADVERVHTLSELGVVLVMFAVGLEFSLARAVKVLPVAGLTAVVQIGGMFWVGNLMGVALGLGTVGAVVLGGSVAISSTMVVTKVFEVHPPPADVRSAVLGILVLQDLAAIVLITVVTAVAQGAAVAPSALLSTVGRLVGVMAAGILVGVWTVPRLARRIARLSSPEVDTVFAVGLCFALAAVMEHLGYSPALGAFLGGMLVAESGLGRRFEHLVAPLRDVFAAVFFVSVGMTVDPRLALGVLPQSLLLAVVVILGQAVLVTSAGILSGRGLRQAGHAGLALGQIGEFGFIIMGIGTAAGVVPATMFVVVVVVAVVTAITTPLALRVGTTVFAGIEHRLPHRLRANLSLYAAWVDGLSRGRIVSPTRRAIRRAIRILLLDAAVVSGVIIGASLGWEAAVGWVVETIGSSAVVAKALMVVLTALVAFPFARGMSRAASALGAELGRVAFPSVGGDRPDLTATARRAMAVGLRLAALLATGTLVAALTQPFVHPGLGLVLLAAALGPSALLLWRSGGPLRDHIGSATVALLEALRRDEAIADEPMMEELLHGLGDATPVRLGPGAAAVGQTLAQLDLRALTGATVLAIAHPDRDVMTPSGREILVEGDVLAVAGPHEAIERARELLISGAKAEPPTKTSGDSPVHGTTTADSD